MAEITIKDLIKQIIPSLGQSEPKTLSEAQGAFFEKYNSEKSATDIWRAFLDFLNQEVTNGYLRTDNSKLPITEDLFNQSSLIDDDGNKIETLFDYVNQHIDLNESLFTNLYNSYKNNLENIDLSTSSGFNNSVSKYYWNESVSKILAYLIKNLTKDGIKTELHIPLSNSSKYASIEDVFSINAALNNDNIVKPHLNVNRKSYSSVRGSDLIESDTKLDNVQYTNDIAELVMRLIMPKYSRNVKVEDLNRNFWVISQIIGLIGAYLFEEESPIISMFKKILSELLQLWENLLYLWALFAVSIYNEKTYTDVHTEFLYIPYSEYISYFKFDDFDHLSKLTSDATSLTLPETCMRNILKRLEYLENTYPQSNLCIIPIIRQDNYKHNFYKIDSYLGTIFFDRNKKENGQNGWYYKFFLQVESALSGYSYDKYICTPMFVKPRADGQGTIKYGFNIGPDCRIAIGGLKGSESELTSCSEFLIGIGTNSDDIQKTCKPVKTIENYEEWDAIDYVAFLRTTYENLPNKTSICEYDLTEKKLKFNGFNMIFKDGVGEESYIIEDNIQKPFKYKTWTLTVKPMNDNDNLLTVELLNEPTDINSGGLDNQAYIDVQTQGYYLGEVPSCVHHSKKYEPTFKFHEIYGRPLENRIQTIGIFADISNTITPFRTLIDKDSEDLIKYLEENENQYNMEDFHFFNFQHQYGLNSSSNETAVGDYINSYYDWENGSLNYIVVNDLGLEEDNPILIYDGDEYIFKDSNIEYAEDDKKYNDVNGSFSDYSLLWNPFEQDYIELPGLLEIQRRALARTPSGHTYTIEYKDENDNSIGLNKQRKNKQIILLKDIIQMGENNKFIYTPKTQNVRWNYKNLMYTRCTFGTLDKTGKITKNNWFVKYNKAYMTYAPILDPNLVINVHPVGSSTYEKITFCFKPFYMTEDEYETYNPDQTDGVLSDYKAQWLFYSLKMVLNGRTKDLKPLYYTDSENYYKAPFYAFGWIKNSENSDFTNFLEDLERQQAYKDLMEYVNNPYDYEAIRDNFKAAMNTLGLDLIGTCTYNIIDSIIFSNRDYAVLSQAQMNIVDGKNSKKIENTGFFSYGFDQTTYLPNFQYNNQQDIEYNYDSLMRAVNLKSNIVLEDYFTNEGLVYRITDTPSFVTGGAYKPKLNFYKYKNNGSRTYNGQV